MIKEGNVKVDYSDLIELGFKKVELRDCVHFSQYGYPYFILAYGESDDQISMEWSPVSREVNLYIKTNLYKSCLAIDEVKNIIDMLEDEV